MSDVHLRRVTELQRRMTDEEIDLAVVTDPDSIYYVANYWGYMGVELGRPTIVLVPKSGDCVLITPGMEAEMARHMTWIKDVREWVDGIDGEWTTPLENVIKRQKVRTLATERLKIPALISTFINVTFPNVKYVDVSRLLGEMRMIKTQEEIAIMRQAGQVAIAMNQAAEKTIGIGVPEYEVALAIIAGGTRKAAEFLDGHEADQYVSPTIYNLQVLQSGHDTCMVHRRSTTRRIQRGDPIYLCYCGIANFKEFKLGFDRFYFVGAVTDEQARNYEMTIRAQRAALSAVRSGVLAEEVHAAADAVYREAGFAPGYRTGRAIGYSILEKPELKAGDKTPLQAGMTVCVDAGISVPGRYGTRVGDSIVVTKTGFEYLTPYPKELRVL